MKLPNIYQQKQQERYYVSLIEEEGEPKVCIVNEQNERVLAGSLMSEGGFNYNVDKEAANKAGVHLDEDGVWVEAQAVNTLLHMLTNK